MSVQEQIDRLLAQRAAEWFEVYRTGQTEQYPQFVAWLSESPRHVEEFLEIAGRYAAVRDVLRDGAVDHDALLRKLAPTVTSMRFALARKGKSSRTRRSRWAIGVAAAVLLSLIPLGIWRYGASHGQTFTTQVGEQRVLQLQDGSVLTLNAQSHAEIEIEATQREVRLTQGEGLFKVAPDPRRPFLVHTPGATVRAIGTEFNVYARPDGSTTVAVLEGRVEVSDQRSESAMTSLLVKSGERVSLGSGEMARVAPVGRVEIEAKADVNLAIAWRQRRLVFDRTPLEEIVQEFNRYNRALKLELVDVPPQSYHFTGAFNADDPQSLAVLLMREPGLQVKTSDGEILISLRADQ